jgi:hypothetical protein
MLFAMMRHSESEKNERKPAEDERLNKTNEQLQSIEGQSKNPRDKECGDEQKYFPGGHVSKKTEGEADNAHKLTQRFQDAHKYMDEAGDEPAEASFYPAFYYQSKALEKSAHVNELAQVAHSQGL